MNWFIPAKTFFLGEYVAMTGAPAIILTTEPCFKVTLTNEPGLQGIHPDSPAGRYWIQQGHADQGLAWQDPYHGCGGLGASSAQWLGACLASHFLQKKPIDRHDLLDAYFQSAWQGIGVRPSGYDVMAQSHQGCVYIHQQQSTLCHYSWPFADLAFILLHTGQKLATHQHLESLSLAGNMDEMVNIVISAKSAFESADSGRLIEAVNHYHECLRQQNRVAEHSLALMQSLKDNPTILAMKGCGAMGADVLLLIVSANQLAEHTAYFSKKQLTVLATSENLHNPANGNVLISNNSKNT